MFRKGGTYRHINCLDIDIYVMNVCHVSQERYKLKVVYALQRNGELMGFKPERVVVRREHLKNWKRIS